MLGQKIKTIREQKGLSCSELSRRAGHSVSTIHGIETGANANPSFRVICNIADVLDISIEVLKKELKP